MSLESLGWNDRFSGAWSARASDGHRPARVLLEQRQLFGVHDGTAEIAAEVSGKLRHAAGPQDFPAVGDWVAVSQGTDGARATIHEVLPRSSTFSRKVAGDRTRQQVVAANVDTVFLVCGLDGDFNPRRIERYLTATSESGARPVLVLNKTDVAADADSLLAEAQKVAMGVPVHGISAANGDGVDELLAFLGPGQTVALLGSSGVGKSTLINRLLGRAVQATREVRPSDSRGRHTTRHRQLFLLDGGALLLDTPGMRELQLWSGDTDTSGTFEEIAALAGSCRFRDCRHQGEQGCAVAQAVERGELSAERLDSYHKLGHELRQLETRKDAASRAQERERLRVLSRGYKKIQKHNRKR